MADKEDGPGAIWRSARRWARAMVSSTPTVDHAPTSVSAPSTASPSVLPDPLRLAPGALLGGYCIERLLARGAMGALYLATEPHSGLPLALKTLCLAQEFESADLATARDRFLREAEAATRLRHPDIVTVFGAGEDDGLAYIAMEALSGSDLSRYTRPARLLPEPVVLRIVARVVDALAYAHGQGVVHRDIKPANVMVDLAAHQVKLTDFGIARLTDSARTRTGLVLGTPSFMSPEQLAGDRVDGRSDLYSVGVMLFQLLTGRLPYEGDSMGQLLRAVATRPPLDLAVLRPELPLSLAAAVRQSLAKRPDDRQQDVADFARVLRQVADMPAFGPAPRAGSAP